MYLDRYGLQETPFSAAPDPRFAFLTDTRAAVLARLEQEVRVGSGGIVLLTAPHGTGKTLLSQLLLERLADPAVRVTRIINTGAGARELMQTICSALRVPVEPDAQGAHALVDALSTFLMDVYAQGQRVVLMVDEAQRLSDASLEQLRMLTNLETPAHKLIHILLLGSPLLLERLESRQLKPLAQRIAVREQLVEFTQAETEEYVRYRLSVAGASQVPFSRLALRALHRSSHGNPRLINIIAERALRLGANAAETVIGERLVQQAARESMQGYVRHWLRQYRRWWMPAAVLALVVALAWTWMHWSGLAPAPLASTAGKEAHIQTLHRAERLAQAIPDAATAQSMAWSEMLARWQVSSSEASVAQASHCHTVISPGFDCVAGTGTLEQLKRFDRPLVLELDTAEGKRQVVLLGVGPHNVRLDLGPRDVDVPHAVLLKLWQGRFYAPFRLPSWMPTHVNRGAAGRSVAWIDQRFQGMDSDEGGAYRPAIFDRALELQVRKLQKGFGIPVDGVVGPETLFAFSSLLDTGPHLARDVK